MAERRYSESDRVKMVQDGLADLRAKGIDATAMHGLHPDGDLAALKELKREIGYTRDQSQEQVERSREQVRNLGRG